MKKGQYIIIGVICFLTTAAICVQANTVKKLDTKSTARTVYERK